MDRLISVSLIFGVYASLVGIAIVFVTLVAVAAASEVLRRLLIRRSETIPAVEKKRARAAAMAAVHYYLSHEDHPRTRAASKQSRWSIVARIEATRGREARFG